MSMACPFVSGSGCGMGPGTLGSARLVLVPLYSYS